VTPDKAIDLVRKIVALVLDVVPAPVAKQIIDDEAVKRANRVADLAEDAAVISKFGLEKPELDE
jgi:hypothetical protein